MSWRHDEHCAECGAALTPEDAWAREGDDGYEYVCGECRWSEERAR